MPGGDQRPEDLGILGLGKRLQSLRLNLANPFTRQLERFADLLQRVFAFEADPALAQPLYLFLALKAGSCSAAQFIPGPDRPDVGFVLRAPFRLWQDILERRTMAATAILTGKMSVDGSKMTLLKHTSASRALIHCTASVDTEFPE